MWRGDLVSGSKANVVGVAQRQKLERQCEGALLMVIAERPRPRPLQN